ncbi:unnamed protein product [Vicia faba]|uniref:Uncharacterized protein n=1 Tax=Vicia faba TaxID=3906 RepID=A0AAV0YDD0_VICFA|nr:unnamed protein product [Vicia faba]
MKNLVDEIWTNCPPAEIKAVVVQPLEFAGRSVIDKLLDLRKKFVQEHAQGLVVTTLDEVAWLYVSIKVKTHLEENGIEIKEYTEVSIDVALLATNELDSVSTTKSLKGKHQTGEESSNLIWDDPTSCCCALYSKLNPDTVLLQQSPLALPKALKVEPQGSWCWN